MTVESSSAVLESAVDDFGPALDHDRLTVGHVSLPAAHAPAPELEEIRQVVDSRTSGRIRALQISTEDGALVVSGRAATYHSKQLATSALRECRPDDLLRNDVVVEHE